MLADTRVRDFKIRRQPVHHIVGVQHGVLGNLTQAVRPVGADIGISTDEDTEVAVKSFDPANRFRSAVV
ncbi:hypothetical protein D3C79_897910 [compost metagenome]